MFDDLILSKFGKIIQELDKEKTKNESAPKQKELDAPATIKQTLIINSDVKLSKSVSKMN